MNRIALVVALASVAVATPTFDTTNMAYTTPQRNIQQRLGFGANAGVGLGDFGGFNAGVQVGNPFNNALLTTMIFGLGIIAFFNLMVTLLVPLFSNLGSSSSSSSKTNAESDAVPRSLSLDWNTNDVIDMAKNVIGAVEKLQATFEK